LVIIQNPSSQKKWAIKRQFFAAPVSLVKPMDRAGRPDEHAFAGRRRWFAVKAGGQNTNDMTSSQAKPE